MAKKHYKGKYERIRITLKSGKVKDIYYKNNEEMLEKLKRARENDSHDYQLLYNPTLDQYYQHFTEIRRTEVKESTLRSQKSQIKQITDIEMTKGTRFGDMHIKDITRRNIEDARQKLLDKGKSPQGINIAFAHLNHVLNMATIDETIKKNPCKALKPLKRDDTPEVSETTHRALSEDETVRFFTAAKECNSYYYNVFLFMIKTGMRIGEVAALYPTDIDKHKGFIHVRRTVRRNEAGRYNVGDDAKTSSGKRDIPLTDDILQVIKDQEKNNHITFGLSKDGLIFRSVEGNIMRDYSVDREIARICQMADIEYFSSHAFRNTYSTRFMEQRPQDFKILSEILGHKDVSITLNLYTHVMIEKKVNAMKDVVIKIG